MRAEENSAENFEETEEAGKEGSLKKENLRKYCTAERIRRK